jgi:hypothetical protein
VPVGEHLVPVSGSRASSTPSLPLADGRSYVSDNGTELTSMAIL